MPDAPTNCGNCGVCCLGLNLMPAARFEDDVAVLPSAMLEALDRVADGPLSGPDNAPCIWLNRFGGTCMHYELRPNDCRDFQLGSETCLRLRAKHGVPNA